MKAFFSKEWELTVKAENMTEIVALQAWIERFNKVHIQRMDVAENATLIINWHIDIQLNPDMSSTEKNAPTS